MLQDQETASLHAGLIERARPRKALTPRVVSLQPRASAPMGGGGDVQGAALTDRAGAPVAERPALEAATPVAPASGARGRYALTVRVEPELRWALGRETQTTGQTLQAVLHKAVRAYLAPRTG